MNKLPIDKDELYPVVSGFPLTGKEISAKLILNQNGDVGWIDISFDEYKNLPEMETPQYMLDSYEAIIKAEKGK